MSDLIASAVKGFGTKEELLSQTVVLFRDYYWKGLDKTSVKAEIDAERGLNKTYKSAVLILLGLAE